MAKRDETLEMARLYQDGLKMREIGNQYGISKQTIQKRLASLGITAEDRPPKWALIDKDRLEFLYAKERLSIVKIGEAFGESSPIIDRALDYHKIPKRRSIKKDGKYIDVLRRLEIGETAEIECTAKKPYVVLHQSSKDAGIKISMRKSGDKFKVTRVG